MSIFLFFLAISIFILAFKKIKSQIIRTVFSGSTLLVVLLGSVFLGFNQDWNYTRKLFGFEQIWDSYVEYKSALKEINTIHTSTTNFNVKKSATDNQETHVVIIGESTSRHHMGLYGYERNTNPKLKSVEDSLFIVEGVKANHVHTVQSLNDVFYPDSFGKKLSLIQLLNQAGYYTVWLSNQSYSGKNENLSTSIAKQCDEQHFVASLGQKSLDEQLIAPFKKSLLISPSKKIIFVHLMGTHLSYYDRYPPSFQKFKAEEISLFGKQADEFVNNYDNAILYNDSIVWSILKGLRSVKGKKSLLYFSDHGDEVYDYRDFHGHQEGKKSQYMEDVPFLIYANDWGNFEHKKLQKPYFLKNLVHTLHELYGFESDVYQVEKSILHQEKGTGTFQEFIHQPLPLQIQEKVWVHRVNSLPRFDEVSPFFTGFELDLVWENGLLDVRHPPAKSIDLDLNKYLQHTEKNSQNNYWFDIKNINENNSKAVLHYLEELNQLYRIKERIIIESPNVTALSVFFAAGYFTSLYLPGHENWAMQKNDSILSELSKKREVLDGRGVSQSLPLLSSMNENFPTSPKLIWALNYDWLPSSPNAALLSFLERHPEIKICLVNYSTPSWR